MTDIFTKHTHTQRQNVLSREGLGLEWPRTELQ